MEVAPDILLRALAICLVTYNHAHPYPTFSLGWGGGMTVLMMLSGYNFAKFGMQGASANDAARALSRLGLKIFVPSLVAVLLCFAVLRAFSLSELLFYRNWISLERISKFPTWYPQVILQMFAGLVLLFSIPGLGDRILRKPFPYSLALFSVAVAIRVTFPRIWDTSGLHNLLPHLYLWNFLLGWVVYFANAEVRSVGRKVVTFVCAVVGAYVGWGIHALDFWCLTLGVLLLTLDVRITLWTPLARIVFVISQATFGIFLVHRMIYKNYEHFHFPANQDLEWIVGLGGSILLWVAAVIPVRAYRSLRPKADSENLDHGPIVVIVPPIDAQRAY